MYEDNATYKYIHGTSVLQDFAVTNKAYYHALDARNKAITRYNCSIILHLSIVTSVQRKKVSSICICLVINNKKYCDIQ